MKLYPVSRIEILENRIAPASTSTMFTDVDGDHVTIKVTNTGAAISDISTHLTFDCAGHQLELIDLTDPSYQGADVAITVKKAGGDGLVNVGRINATGRDLGNVSIAGDLGDFDGGAAGAHGLAVGSLTVNSLGKVGLVSQGGAGDLNWAINGSMGPVLVKADVQNVNVFVTPGDLASLTINGSLLGGTTDNSGKFEVAGSIGPVIIGKDVVGGSGAFSAYVSADGGDIASLKIGGSLKGGGDPTHSNSGYFSANGAIPGGVAILGDMIGGNGSESANILTDNGDIGDVLIGGSLQGGGGAAVGNNAYIYAAKNLGNVTIGKNLTGSAALDSAYIYASGGNIGNVLIKGTVQGGAGRR